MVYKFQLVNINLESHELLKNPFLKLAVPFLRSNVKFLRVSRMYKYSLPLNNMVSNCVVSTCTPTFSNKHPYCFNLRLRSADGEGQLHALILRFRDPKGSWNKSPQLPRDNLSFGEVKSQTRIFNYPRARAPNPVLFMG